MKYAGLRGELFGRFKHRLRKVPGLGSCRGMQQESCLHAEGQGTCTHIFRFYILMHFKLFCHYRLGRHLCHKSCSEMWLVWKSRPIFCQFLHQLPICAISSRSVPTLVHLRNGRWMNANNGLCRANAIGIPNSCCRSVLPYAATWSRTISWWDLTDCNSTMLQYVSNVLVLEAILSP